MTISNFPQYFGNRVQGAQTPSSLEKLISGMNEKAGETSPLEAAKQALLRAKTELEEHRNEKIEQALEGCLALRSRQTSRSETS